MIVAQSLIPIFKEEEYKFMEYPYEDSTQISNLWDFIEYRYAYLDEECKLSNNNQKDSKALVIIQ